MDDRKLYLRLTRPEYGPGGGYTIPLDSADTIADEMRDGEPGDVLRVELVELTEEAYAALPEFEGW